MSKYYSHVHSCIYWVLCESDKYIHLISQLVYLRNIIELNRKEEWSLLLQLFSLDGPVFFASKC